MKALRNCNLTDLLVSGGFLLLGIYLVVSGNRLPAGAGFFPMVLGLVMLALSIGLVFQSICKSGGEKFSAGNIRILFAVALLTGVYLALWGTGWFSLRTFVFLVILLRMLGESWRTGVMVSAVLSVGVTLAFKYGLHVAVN